MKPKSLRKMIVFSFILLVFILLSSLCYAASKSGQCGPNASFVIDDSNTLTISGTGDITSHPWYDSDYLNSYHPSSIVIEEGITSICGEAFYNNTQLRSVSLPDSLESIGIGCFSSCNHLQKVDFPKGLKTIGEYAFSLCTELISITFQEGLTNIDNNAFYNCYSLKNFILPDSIVSIGNGAFYGCSAITEITIPNGVSKLGSVFSGCSSLRAVNLPDSITVLDGTFAGCNIPGISLPAKLEIIGDNTFTNCSNLKMIEIPYGVTEIGVNAFVNCTYLSNVIIPASVVSIGIGSNYDIFSGCSSLKKIEVPACNTYVINHLTSRGYEDALNIGPHIDIVRDEAVSPTCTTTGLTVGSHCAYCGKDVVSQLVVDALGHDWRDTVYEWAEDNKSVSAYHVCKRDSSHEEKETARTTTEITLPPTCTEMGETTYTGTFLNPLFEQQSKTLTDIPELGHNWSNPTYTWSDNNTVVTAERICRNDAAHIDSESTDVSYVLTSPTESSAGSITYTSNDFVSEIFSVQTRKIQIPALRDMTVLRLPDDLESITAESFENLACEAILVPKGCIIIEDYAFRNCMKLKYIRYFANTDVSDDAFDGCDNYVIDVVTDK